LEALREGRGDGRRRMNMMQRRDILNGWNGWNLSY